MAQTLNNEISIINPCVRYSDDEIILQHSNATIVFKRDRMFFRNEPDYFNPMKRFRLSECIETIYIVNGFEMEIYWTPMEELSTHYEMCKDVDCCIQQKDINGTHAAMLRVKRKLFHNNEKRSKRKQSKPLQIKPWGTQLLNFKPIRQHIENRKIRRDFFKPARKLIIDEMIRENQKREMTQTTTTLQCFKFNDYDTPNFPVKAGFMICHRISDILAEICRYHYGATKYQRQIQNKMSPLEYEVRQMDGISIMQRAIQLETILLHEPHLIIEESLRSTSFSQKLVTLANDHEVFVHVDNRIMAYW